MHRTPTRWDRWQWWFFDWRPRWWPSWFERPVAIPTTSPWRFRLAIARVASGILFVGYWIAVRPRPWLVVFFLYMLAVSASDARREWRLRRARRHA